MPHHVRIILNPISGEGHDGRFLGDLLAQLELRRVKTEVCCIAGPGDGPRLAAETPDEVTTVVSIGGDGTHRAVLAGLMGRPVPVCVVPAGTENVLAKTFHLTGTVKEVVTSILEGRPVELDVGFAGETPFVQFSGIGFDAAVTRVVHETRRGPIRRSRYYAIIGRMLWTYEFPSLTVTVDGRRFCDDAGFVVVGNTPRFCDEMRITPRAVADDGLLDVVCFREHNAVRFYLQYLRIKVARHVRHPRVDYGRGRRIEVAANGTPADVQIDGDWIDRTPVTYTLRPRAVRLLLPPPAPRP